MLLRDHLLGLPRRSKRLLQVLADVLLVWISLWLAFVVRLGSFDEVQPLGEHAWLLRSPRRWRFRCSFVLACTAL